MSPRSRKPCRTRLAGAALGLACLASTPPPLPADWPRFAPDEIALAASLKLDPAARPPSDASNRWADHEQAAQLGKALFFDPRLSANGRVACASCHRPEAGFADTVASSQGLAASRRNTPALFGGAWARWFFWDGRADSQWAQAIEPLLSPGEHGLTRTGLVRAVARHHGRDYVQIFGPLPVLPELAAGPEGDARAAARWRSLPENKRRQVNQAVANIAKALAAYERTLTPAPARFDRFAAALTEGRHGEARQVLSRDEIQGFRLFVGAARCIQCHNGPLFSNQHFHNTGLHDPESDPVHVGRTSGLTLSLDNEFNCLGRYSDDTRRCALRFTGKPEQIMPGSFKTPSLRNVAQTAPYMRTGEFATLAEVIEHYDLGGRSRARPGVIGNELTRLWLDPLERRQIEAFLGTLTSLPAP